MSYTFRRAIDQKGFEAVAIGVALLLASVVGFAGYKVMNMNKVADTAQTASTVQSVAPTTIKTKADLAKTTKALDTSSTQLNSKLDDTSLDSDLNATL